MSNNTNLNKATVAKNDEFYTLLSDVEKELLNYSDYFKDQVVYCNCDGYNSNFVKYFHDNFHDLKLKQLIATCYAPKNDAKSGDAKSNRRHAMYMSYDGKGRVKTKRLKGDGSYDGEECVAILRKADIISTNPPFSKAKDYIQFLVDHGKQFIILGNLNSVSVKNVFELLMKNKVWLGYNHGNMKFRVPSDNGTQKYKGFGNICWYTNLKVSKKHKALECHAVYDSTKHLKYDEYDAVNIDKIRDIIAMNSDGSIYDGKMGVPVSIMTRFDKNKFNILGLDAYISGNKNPGNRFKINGRKIYARIVIEHRKDKLRTQK